MGAFTMIDTGMAVYEKMMINQVLRAGAQPAFSGAEESEVLETLQQSAAANFSVASGDAQEAELALAVESYCACPGEASGEVACTAPCGSGGAAFRFYRLTAAKTFQGVMLPAFTLAGALEVMSE
jgi:pilus assembly protein CpaE